MHTPTSTALQAPLTPDTPATRAPWRDWLVSEPAIGLASVLSLLLIWYAGTLALPANILPPPHTVVQTIGELVQGHELWSDVAISLTRIGLAFVLGMGIATALGFAMAISPRAGSFFRIWIVCGITVPSIVTILTIYLIVGMNDRAAVLGAALTVVPFLAINIREGVKSIDTRLIHMGRVFRAKRWQMLRAVMLPQVAPMLLASARFGLGLVWKMVLFVELLGRGDGIGYRIEHFYQLFDMTSVLAYALSFLVVMLVIEIGIFGVIERRVFRWKR